MSRPSILDFLFLPIITCKGVGKKISSYLERSIGNRVVDLLLFIPNKVQKKHYTEEINNKLINQHITFQGTVVQHLPSLRNGSPYRITVVCKQKIIILSFFFQKGSFLYKTMPLGKQIFVSGVLCLFRGQYTINHPEIDFLKPTVGIRVIYPNIPGVSGKKIQLLIENIFDQLPKSFLWYNLLWNLHHPNSNQDLLPSNRTRKKLAYYELLAFQLRLLYHKRQVESQMSFPVPVNHYIRNIFLKNLPFSLTNSQKNALQNIDREMNQSKRMIHLLQGDVGSGKTIVAVLSGLSAMINGMKMILMAPTSVLAQQHAMDITKWLSPLGLKTILITRNNTKSTTIQEIEKSSCIIGTHALLSTKMQYTNIALIVIDEQHRFGVYQRLHLSQKNVNAHILVMTATPIPRTLAITLYGDFSMSRLLEKPKNRKIVHTSFLHEKKIDSLISAMNRILEKNEKIFWICALIQDKNPDTKSNVTSLEERLSFLKNYFSESVLFVLHGKMDLEQKHCLIKKFQNSLHGILLTTSIIEVGINIPSASVMVIENPERFGLSTLHQLRGRLARGNLPGYCIILINSFCSKDSISRLKIFQKTTNSFFLAEEDLKRRGIGDIFGYQQSGFPSFRFFNFEYHANLLPIVKKQASRILSRDNKLIHQYTKALICLFTKNEVLESENPFNN